MPEPPPPAKGVNVYEGLAQVPFHDADAAFAHFKKMYLATDGQLGHELEEILVDTVGREVDKYLRMVSRFIVEQRKLRGEPVDDDEDLLD